jgi:TAG lipase / lysophosphatidylethanolamine acyltransferase
MIIVWIYKNLILPTVETALSYLPSKQPKSSNKEILLEEAKSLKDYEENAILHDSTNEAIAMWKRDHKSPFYDSRIIVGRLEKLRKLSNVEDYASMMFFLRAGIIRNLAGINDRRLYRIAKSGTKALVEDYVDETIIQLQKIAECQSLPKEQVKEFFKDIKRAHGNSALLLHGGASFGLCHLGVIKALLEKNLLPKIICGTFIGAIIGAMIATRTKEELILEIFNQNTIDFGAFEVKGSGLWASFHRKLVRFLKTGKLFDVKILEKFIHDNIGDMTFREAFQKSGLVLNIVVNPEDDIDGSPVLFNHISAPDVVIWSAACAACAIPGMYGQVEIRAKDANGLRIRPWNIYANLNFGFHDIYGNLRDRMAEWFGVNNIIVSQVPSFCAIRPRYSSDEGSRWFGKSIYNWILSEIEHFYDQFRALGIVPKFVQKWEKFVVRPIIGDVCIIPILYFGEIAMLVKNPDDEFIQYCVRKGERFAWKRLKEIEMRCRIEFEIDRLLASL